MNSPVTIDASVFVSTFTPSEPAHQASKAFILNVREQDILIIVPVLVLPEISAALSRGQVKPELGKAFVQELRNFPSTTFIAVDHSIAILAVDIAANNRWRGSDAVYAAVALRFETELITLDREPLDRLPKVLSVRAPSNLVSLSDGLHDILLARRDRAASAVAASILTIMPIKKCETVSHLREDTSPASRRTKARLGVPKNKDTILVSL